MNHDLPPQQLAEIRATLDAKDQRLVLTNGCFDILHAGHVRYLQQARALGDALVVAINSDASVTALKGPSRPVNCLADRAEVLAALGCVDYVTSFDGERITEIIPIIRPHLYAKGGDYTEKTLHRGEFHALKAAGTEIQILPLVPGRSTSTIVAALKSNSA